MFNGRNNSSVNKTPTNKTDKKNKLGLITEEPNNFKEKSSKSKGEYKLTVKSSATNSLSNPKFENKKHDKRRSQIVEKELKIPLKDISCSQDISDDSENNLKDKPKSNKFTKTSSNAHESLLASIRKNKLEIYGGTTPIQKDFNRAETYRKSTYKKGGTMISFNDIDGYLNE